MKKAVVTDRTFPTLDHEERAARESGATLLDAQVKSSAQVSEALQGADAVIVGDAHVDEAALRGMNAGGTLIRYGIGYDNVDVAAATRLGLRVCNVPDYGADTVADHTVMLALAALRRLEEFNQTLRTADGWMTPPQIGTIPALSDVTVGLVGVGQIGLKVATRLQAFGAAIIAADPYASADRLEAAGIGLVELPELLQRADIVSLHAPLTSETRHIIDAGAIAAMKDTAIIVNTGRGGLIDTAAAAAAVTNDELGGLAFDVFETEPLPAGHPLRSAPRTLLTPHAAFYSARSLDNIQRLAAEEMGRALRREPLRCPVN